MHRIWRHLRALFHSWALIDLPVLFPMCFTGYFMKSGNTVKAIKGGHPFSIHQGEGA